MRSTLGAVAELPDEFRPLRRAEYERLVEAGVYEGQRVELLGGVLVEVAPQSEPHSDAIRFLNRVFGRSLGEDVELGVQTPLGVDDISLPEPDLSVLPAGRYRQAHPERALLVVEVAVSSLRIDLGEKARRYAAAGFPEYWVIEPIARRVHVHTDPRPDGSWGRTEVVEQGLLRPALLEQVAVDLDDLFRPDS